MNEAARRHPEIEQAIKIVGSQAELARRCRCSQQTISKVLNREIAVAAELARDIDLATGGAVPRWKMRPDLWDEIEHPTGSSSPVCPPAAPQPEVA